MSDEEPVLTTVFVDERAQKRRLKKTRLVVEAGPDASKELVVDRERVTVGRMLGADLVLSDKAVSGTHFEINFVDDDGSGYCWNPCQCA